MKIAFVVNDIATEDPNFTTTRLAMAAVNRGHEAWLIGTGDLAFDPDDHVRARARSVSKKSYKSLKVFLQELQGPKGRTERITVDDLDVVRAGHHLGGRDRRTGRTLLGYCGVRHLLPRFGFCGRALSLHDRRRDVVRALRGHLLLVPEDVWPAHE